MDINEKRAIIQDVNEIIESAIYYGGDLGGAYFNDKDKDMLLEKMEKFRKWYLGDKFGIGIIRNVPIFFETT